MKKARRATKKAPGRSDMLLNDAAADWLGLSPRTLERFRVEGRGPRYIKLGKRVFYLEADLAAYVEASRRSSTSERVAAAGSRPWGRRGAPPTCWQTGRGGSRRRTCQPLHVLRPL